MEFHKKTKGWLVDYWYMLLGAIGSIIYHKPPRHYLEYTKEGKIAVILIPGILGRWGFMKKLGDKISLEGHPVYIVPKLGYNLYSIPSSAKTLRSVIMRILSKKGFLKTYIPKGAIEVRKTIEEENIEGVILVAHSKGGLIGKYLMIHHNADNSVLGMVAIATPFSGSAMVNLIPIESFKEMKMDSEIIRDLDTHKTINKKIISIIPEYDNHV